MRTYRITSMALEAPTLKVLVISVNMTMFELGVMAVVLYEQARLMPRVSVPVSERVELPGKQRRKHCTK